MKQKIVSKFADAYVVRDFNVGHTKSPHRFIGIEFEFDNEDETGRKQMLFVIEPSDAAEIIRTLQKELPKVSQ